MRAFFHLRRFDGQLETDSFGRDIAADQLLLEATSGAKRLVCEAINEELPLTYRQFEIENDIGTSLLDFSFDRIIRYVAEAQRATVKE